MTPEERHQVAVLRGKIAHKIGKEKEEAYEAYWRAKNGKERTDNLPITSRLRYHCATRALPLPASVT